MVPSPACSPVQIIRAVKRLPARRASWTLHTPRTARRWGLENTSIASPTGTHTSTVRGGIAMLVISALMV